MMIHRLKLIVSQTNGREKGFPPDKGESDLCTLWLSDTVCMYWHSFEANIHQPLMSEE